MARLIVAMGHGLDRTGQDPTAAALAALADALSHSSLPVLAEVAGAPRILATIGAPDPAAIDQAALLPALPPGTREVKIVPGGLDVSDTPAILVAASVEVFVPSQGD